MRIPSGVVDQYLYFVAVDATDLHTRETGLSSFTVYRSRNGGAAAAYTSPTINETDSVNMPGVYELLLDEDMTIDSGDDTQEVCLHITHAGMDPVTRTFELYRPKITAGLALTVEADGMAHADVKEIEGVDATNTLDAHIDARLAAYDPPTYAEMAARTLLVSEYGTAANQTIIASTMATAAELAKVPKSDGTVTWNATAAAQIQSEANDALVAYDPPTKAEMDTAVDALPTAAENADAVWTEAIADHSGVAGSTAEQLAAAGAAGDPWATTLPGSYASGQAGKILGDNLNATVSSRASQASLDDVPTNAELATALAAADDAVLAEIAALNNLSAAQVATEISDFFAVDAHAEPTGVPAANASLGTKLGYLYLALRNRVDVTGSKKTFYGDDGSAEFEQDLSDDGTTYSQSEANAL